MNKKKTTIICILVLAIAIFIVGCSQSNGNKDVQKTKTDSNSLRFATLSMGSSWYSYGATIADIIKKAIPSIQKVDVLPNSGGVGNIKLLEQGKAEIALGFGNINKWAVDGTAAFQDKKVLGLQGLVGSLDEYYIGIVASEKSGIASLRQVAEKKIPIKLMTVERGSAGEYANRQVLAAHGITYEDIKKWGGSVEHTDFNSIVNAFKDGKADMFMQVISKGHPAVSELSVSGNIKFVALDEAALSQMAKYGYISTHIPANSFKGQTTDVNTAGLASCLMTTDKMSNDLAYKITKAVYENPTALAKGHQALMDFKPKLAADTSVMGLPIHPGAAKYYKEIGLIK